jgi:hypothetical protein
MSRDRSRDRLKERHPSDRERVSVLQACPHAAHAHSAATLRDCQRQRGMAAVWRAFACACLTACSGRRVPSSQPAPRAGVSALACTVLPAVALPHAWPAQLARCPRGGLVRLALGRHSPPGCCCLRPPACLCSQGHSRERSNHRHDSSSARRPGHRDGRERHRHRSSRDRSHSRSRSRSRSRDRDRHRCVCRVCVARSTRTPSCAVLSCAVLVLLHAA